MDGVFTVTDAVMCSQDEPSASALAVTEAESATPPRMPGSKVAGAAEKSMIGMETRIVWMVAGKALVCLRIHGAAERYVVARVGAADWTPAHGACLALWPAPAHRTSDLPTWDAEALPA
jgi:hypothetical protein